jgi:hypothetical protein
MHQGRGLFDILKDAVTAMRKSMFEFLLELVGRGMEINEERVKEESTINLSGWARANINLDKAPRLREVLAQEGGATEDAPRTIASQYVPGMA